MGQYNKKLRIIANVVLFIMTLLCILPLILLVVSSFTAEEVLVQNGYSFFQQNGGWMLMHIYGKPELLCCKHIR